MTTDLMSDGEVVARFSDEPVISSALWEKLRRPFDLDQIELLPKYTGPRGGTPQKAHCKECGGYHAFPCIHLSYVGHAQITDRLNEVDPTWNWEPCGVDQNGQPIIVNGGMWIKLTVLGVTRYGYGDAQGKTGHDATKEIIGDAIRNAAMRFGVGSYLWSKSERAKQTLVGADEQPESGADVPQNPAPSQTPPDPLMQAKRRFNAALTAHCEAHGLDKEREIELLGGNDFLKKQSAEWFDGKTEYYSNN